MLGICTSHHSEDKKLSYILNMAGSHSAESLEDVGDTEEEAGERQRKEGDGQRRKGRENNQINFAKSIVH